MRSKKLNLVLGGAIVAICALVAFVAVQGQTSTLVRFADLESAGRQRCQVTGKLLTDSIKPIRSGNEVLFELEEDATGQRLTVYYRNPTTALSANFPNASHARVKGYYDANTRRFMGDEVITQCPSKYNDDKLDLETVKREEATKKWQELTGLKPE